MRKSPLPGAFAFMAPGARYMRPSDRNHFHGVTLPMTIPMDRVENRILSIRGHRLMLDADLAGIYSISTRAHNQAIKRNAERFPEDFTFRLTAEKKRNGSQTVTGSPA